MAERIHFMSLGIRVPFTMIHGTELHKCFKSFLLPKVPFLHQHNTWENNIRKLAIWSPKNRPYISQHNIPHYLPQIVGAWPCRPFYGPLRFECPSLWYMVWSYISVVKSFFSPKIPFLHQHNSWENNIRKLKPVHIPPSGGSLPLIFCIRVHSGPIYWGLFTLQKRL